MVIGPTPDRRTVLKTLGAAGALASVGPASAGNHGGGSSGDDDELRLFSEQQVGNGDHGTNEVVTQQNYAYAATGIGMAVVDWRNPGRPELAARIEASEPEEIDGGDNAGAIAADDDGGDADTNDIGDILDVKVDGDIAAMAHNRGTGITTVDVSDPENPEELAFYTVTDETGIHNCFLYEDHAYLTVSAARVIQDKKGVGVRIFGNTGVEIVDISDPSDPSHAATWYLREELPAYANASVNPNHDVYVQDDLLYNVFWDAGCVVLDVSDPADPEFVTQFGEAPNGDQEIRPYRPDQESFEEYFAAVFPYERYLTNPGNAHYVQPSKDGEYTFVGDETFPGEFKDPENDTYGGIRVFDTSDWEDVEQVGFIEPPDEPEGKLRTSHNFDVTANRIHTSWYNGGVRVYDITDPEDPEELSSYSADGYSFWTAVQGRSFTLGGVYGDGSDASAGGVLVLHDDRGAKRPPGFDGSSPPDDPGIGMEPDQTEE